MAWAVTSSLPSGEVRAAWTEPDRFACSDPAIEADVLATEEVWPAPPSGPVPFDLADAGHVALAYDAAMATRFWPDYRRSGNVWADDDPPPPAPPVPEGVTP